MLTVAAGVPHPAGFAGAGEESDVVGTGAVILAGVGETQVNHCRKKKKKWRSTDKARESGLSALVGNLSEELTHKTHTRTSTQNTQASLPSHCPVNLKIEF